MILLSIFPIPNGLKPSCLSKGINLHAKKAFRCFAVLSWHNLLVISAIAFLNSSPGVPKFSETSILRQQPACRPEGPAKIHVLI